MSTGFSPGRAKDFYQAVATLVAAGAGLRFPKEGRRGFPAGGRRGVVVGIDRDALNGGGSGLGRQEVKHRGNRETVA